MSNTNRIRLGLCLFSIRVQRHKAFCHVLNLWSSQLWLLHPSSLVNSGFPRQTLSQPAVIEFSISLTFEPHALLLACRQVYIVVRLMGSLATLAEIIHIDGKQHALSRRSCSCATCDCTSPSKALYSLASPMLMLSSSSLRASSCSAISRAFALM